MLALRCALRAAAAPTAGAAGARALADFAVDPFEAARLVRAMATAGFDESVDLAVVTGLDPRRPNQSIRASAALPHGTGRRPTVAVFAQGHAAEAAREAGADFVGAEDLAAQIRDGEIAFDRVIAAPDQMAVVGSLGRILGPRGLMPNPKAGTVTPDVAGAVRQALLGQVFFRTDRHGNVHAPVGRASFSEDQLVDNMRAFMLALTANKPEGAKGTFLRKVTLSSTMGRGIPLALTAVNPDRIGFFKRPEAL